MNVSLPSFSSDEFIYGDMHRIKKKIKLAMGYTNTATQTKTDNDGWQETGGSGIKFKKLNIAYKLGKQAKLIKSLSQQGTTYELTTNGQVSAQGAQEPKYATETVGAQINLLYQALTSAAASLPGAQESKQMFFKGSTEEIEFFNPGATTMEFEVYVLIDKITATTTKDPVIAWTEGITSETGDGVGPVESFRSLWTRPTSNKTFNMLFWTRRHHCVLTPGERCKLTVTFTRNRVLDTQYFADYNTIRGITHRIVTVQRGVLCDADNSDAYAANRQSISQTKLVWLLKKTLAGSLVNSFPRVHKQLGAALPSALPLMHIDEDTGEPEFVVTTEFA